MADYSVTFARSACKELEDLPANVAYRILQKIESLSKNPRSPGTIKLQGRKNFWRMRVGDYRVIYSIIDSSQVVDIAIIRHRRDVYRDL
jgi:mRNA interferase RelE/StbE